MRLRAVFVVVLLAGLAAAGWLGLQWLSARRHLHAAEAALVQHDPDTARMHLALCLEYWPRRADVHLLAARAARRAGQYDEAEEHLHVYQQRQGPDDAFSFEQMLLRAQRGDLAESEPYLRARLQTRDTEAAIILEALGQGYVRTLRLPEALRCAEQLLEREPGHVEGLVAHGWAMEQLNRLGEAIDDYRRVMARRPTHEWARLCLGELLLYQNQPGEALEHFEYLAGRRPDNAAVFLGLARCRRGLGQNEEARRLLDDLAGAHPREPLVLSERGQLALAEGRPEEAERWLRQAVALMPSNRQAIYALAQALQQLDQSQAATSCMEQVERIDAGRKRLQELSEEILKTPRAAALRAEAGRLCLRLGKEEEGVQWLLSALREDPRHVESHEALAEHYARTGQHALAARHRELASGQK